MPQKAKADETSAEIADSRQALAQGVPLLRLQLLAGNAAVVGLLKSPSPELPGVQRQGVETPARSRSGVGSDGPLPAAMDYMRQQRTNATLLNTLNAIESGSMHVMYLEDCRVRREGSERILTNPHTGEEVVRSGVAVTGAATYRDRYVYVSRNVDVREAVRILVHEVNHNLRVDGGRSLAERASFDRYRDEFQAYWVERLAVDGGPDAQVIRAHVLHDYPWLRIRYQNDRAFRLQVDEHVRPDGNTINSVIWMRLQSLLFFGATQDVSPAFRLLRSLTRDQRLELAGDENFTGMVRERLPGPVGHRFLTVLNQ